MTILDGKAVSKYIKDKVKEETERIKEETGKKVTLAVVLVGSDPASEIYVSNKVKACEKCGIESKSVLMDESVSQDELEEKIKELASDDTVNGILVQLPLPKKFDEKRVISLIPKEKDADGLTKDNVSSLVMGEDGIIPCTPKGVVDILKYYDIDVSGKRVAIIGRSMLVGKPLFSLLTNMNATVTLCHSKTNQIEEITRESDIVVCALGRARYLKRDMVKNGSVIIDVGINRVDGKVVGDCDFEELKDVVSYITPVPGGCGPMTVAELMSNTVECFKMQNPR